MDALSKIKSAGFEVTLEGDGFEISPSSTLTLTQREFLKAHKAEIIAELKAANVSAGDRQAVLNWLHSIGESDQEIVTETLERCANDPAALAYFLRRAGEANKATVESGLIICRNCQHFNSFNLHGGGAGKCGAGVRAAGNCLWAQIPRTPAITMQHSATRRTPNER